MLNTNDARSHVCAGRYDIVFVAKWGKENESAVNQLALGSPKYPVECPPNLMAQFPKPASKQKVQVGAYICDLGQL